METSSGSGKVSRPGGDRPFENPLMLQGSGFAPLGFRDIGSGTFPVFLRLAGRAENLPVRVHSTVATIGCRRYYSSFPLPFLFYTFLFHIFQPHTVLDKTANIVQVFEVEKCSYNSL